MKAPTVRIFAPEHWGQLEKFSKFYSPSYSVSKIGARSISGAVNHFNKAITLRNLSIKISPSLSLDRKELEANGYSPAINARELSSVIECVITELYSSLDCTRKLLSEIYKKYRGVPDSTRKFFQKACEGKFDETFPEFLLNVVKEAVWYPELRSLRDELTHSDIGSCHLDDKNQKVFYMHPSLGTEGRALVVEDIFGKLEKLIENVNTFMGKVFWFLNQQLNDEPVNQMCGIFGGRVYTRMVSPHEAVDFNSGQCEAHKWFEKEENPTCPFISSCGAYSGKGVRSLIFDPKNGKGVRSLIFDPRPDKL